MKLTVSKDDSAPRPERWLVQWDGKSTIAALPTQSRAWGFADLVAAIQPLDKDITDLKQDVQDLHERCNELECRD